MHPFKKMVYMLRREDEVVFNNPFDHMVIRFAYTKPEDGTDLDIMVYYDNTSSIYDNEAVGFNQVPNAVKIPTDATPDADAYLWWASDDVSLPAGECVEAVVIGINKFNTDVVTTGVNIETYLRVGWFNAIGGGSIDVEFKTYLGGTMNKVGTDIINIGGTLVNSQTKTVTVSSGTGQVTKLNSNLVGTIVYDKASKTAVLI